MLRLLVLLLWLVLVGLLLMGLSYHQSNQSPFQRSRALTPSVTYAAELTGG